MISTKKPGVRSIELEIEVPGTPEQAWQAIATGPGITAWFVPTEVAEREGGEVLLQIGPGMDSKGVILTWDPPRRFVYEERDWAPGAPPVATEFVIEARAGGTCVVRLVNSLFTSAEDWDDQLEGFEKGWAAFLPILKLYLLYFAGQRCATLQVIGGARPPEDKVWAAVTAGLGLDRARAGERRSASGKDVPPLAGVVERAGAGNELLLAIEEPAPGFALVGTFPLGEAQIAISIRFYLFGPDAPAVVAREEPAWRAWIEANFPFTPPA